MPTNQGTKGARLSEGERELLLAGELPGRGEES
jgi:hypothetical protein